MKCYGHKVRFCPKEYFRKIAVELNFNWIPVQIFQKPFNTNPTQEPIAPIQVIKNSTFNFSYVGVLFISNVLRFFLD